MLDHTNCDLVKEWLRLRADANAAVFFLDDEMQVISRDGTMESFRSSPFNRRLGECLVYLDDAHTRGTDLKLPRTTRAGVTLGPRVTKDCLVQGTVTLLTIRPFLILSYNARMYAAAAVRKWPVCKILCSGGR